MRRQATMSLAEQHATNAAALKVIVSSLVLICELFYSLNYQVSDGRFMDS